MAVFHPVPVTCSCGHAFSADAARSVNVRRNPAVRAQILAGRFHRVNCPACRTRLTLERPFYYSDPDRGAVFQVLPRGERLNHAEDGRRLTAQDAACRLITGGRAPRQVRVVYGLDELREKLVAQDAGLDDRHVELLKLLVLHDHPFLMRTPRLQLALTAASPSRLDFVAYHHHQTRGYRLQLSRFAAESLLGQPAAIEAWLGQAQHRAPLFAPERRWVNVRRWTTRYSALDALRGFAATVRASGEVDFAAPDFARMCDRLPRAGNLSSGAKADLQALFEHARQRQDGAAQDRLFEVRFGIALDDEWGANQDNQDIDTLWQLMLHVPANNVVGNTHLKEIELIADDGGFYQPNGLIQIGRDELADRERFEDVLRHEVGHAVHADHAALVDPWLKREFGWQHFPATQAGIDAWVRLMGGWNAWGPVDTSQRLQISDALVRALGDGESWEPGPRPQLPAGHPWHRPGFGPRLAVAHSAAHWYASFPQWYRAQGLAFALNYWYAELMVVKESTLALILQMPDRYAAMSHFEFFAELYSLYYDIDDPGRAVVPAKVARWLDTHIGRAGLAMPGVPAKKTLKKAPRKAPRKQA